MTHTEAGKKFAALVKRLHAAHDVPPTDPSQVGRPEHISPLLWQLVLSILAWECSPARAASASAKVHAAVVDYNEMRVCLPEELAGMIGDRYPRARERAVRLRSTLSDIFRRQHAVSLDHLPAMNKRDARAYLESLEGCPAFAAARVALLELDGHAVPVDERLLECLASEGAVPDGSTPASASAWLERQLRAGEARATYLMLEAWAAEHPPASKSESKSEDGAKADSKTGPKAQGRVANGARAKRSTGGEKASPRPKRSGKA